MRRPIIGVIVVALLGSCRPDTVDLAYRFEEGSRLIYVMTADASSTWDIGGSSGSGSYRVVFSVRETVLDVQGDEALIRVTMTPVDVDEQGLPSPGAQQRSFVLRAGRAGEVLEVLEVGGVAAADLDPDQLAFIGTYRPPLPLERIRLGGSWESEQQVEVGEVFQRVVTIGEMERLGLVDGERAAYLAYDGGGPLVWSATLPQGRAELSGRSATTSTAVLELDTGVLRRSTSETTGHFDVTAESGEVPVGGTLDLTLRLDLRPAAD